MYLDIDSLRYCLECGAYLADVLCYPRELVIYDLEKQQQRQSSITRDNNRHYRY